VEVREAVWLRKILVDLFGHVSYSTIILRHGAEEGSIGTIDEKFFDVLTKPG